jgi:hypothetical protein
MCTRVKGIEYGMECLRRRMPACSWYVMLRSGFFCVYPTGEAHGFLKRKQETRELQCPFGGPTYTYYCCFLVRFSSFLCAHDVQHDVVEKVFAM